MTRQVDAPRCTRKLWEAVGQREGDRGAAAEELHLQLPPSLVYSQFFPRGSLGVAFCKANWAGSTPGSSCPSRQGRQLLLVVIPVSAGRKPAGERLSPLAKALWALLWRGWRAAGLRQPAHKVSIVPVLRVGMPLLGMLAGSLRCAVISAGPARNRYPLIIQGLRWEPFK